MYSNGDGGMNAQRPIVPASTRPTIIERPVKPRDDV